MGLLHPGVFVKHGTLRLFLEELKFLVSFISAFNHTFVVATSNILMHDAERSESLKDDFIMKKCLKVFSTESVFDLQKC